MSTLLEVNNLKTYFFRKKEPIPAVDGVDFHISKGETVALVGESGSGKSITSLSIMGLVQSSGGKIMDGSIKLEDKDLTSFTENDYCKIRGNEVSMIFQEPMTSLNPVLTIGEQITEVLIYHKNMKKKEAHQKAVELLQMVGFSRAEQMMKEYPHRLSGGMRQRVMIAIALSCNPKLLIADEPTTALDVTIQAQVLELMKDLCQKFNTSILLITHDLGVVSEAADRVIVMYCGQVVENATVDDLFLEPLHPYTEGLLTSIPVIDGEIDKLNAIKGSVPTPDNLPPGCRFAPRCPKAMDKCWTNQPSFLTHKSGRTVRCFLYEEEGAEQS
ncbi:oligopeptide ABC transporter ATP-binding protein AppD [Bacillus spizizenii]|uniref:Oligopeptide ABC transporter ATP-binding protein AppD n=1 Tax=Bacillus spizizenii TaxID=96241 RepID=A0A9Q4HIR3_BACSC|nr:oligopeptide ABC transporter ATP-binding protein AppD [Bacillus spizizenii]MCY8458207.1 oligopeptide ABC transporter ATP-binding protein AppD [Bacillus spizizenii]